VCDPWKNSLLKAGNKNDRVDARKLSELLRAGLLAPVYHGDSGVRTLREMSRSYLTLTKDLTRVMNRLKGLYRSWAIPCAGEMVYSARHRSSCLEQLSQVGVRLYREPGWNATGMGPGAWNVSNGLERARRLCHGSLPHLTESGGVCE
jgi:hypothetical protein